MWNSRFLELAKHIASWSKDPSTQTGAVIVDPRRRIVSVGYNGLPQGVEDAVDRLFNRAIKYKMIVHCERNALLFAERSVKGCTLYTWPFMSCAQCAGMVIQAGITRVVAPAIDETHPAFLRWKDDFEISQTMFFEAGVEMLWI